MPKKNKVKEEKKTFTRDDIDKIYDALCLLIRESDEPLIEKSIKMLELTQAYMKLMQKFNKPPFDTGGIVPNSK